MKVLTIQISDELHTELFHAAAILERSASLFVREAIKEKIAQMPVEAIERLPTRPQPVSADSRTPASSGRREGETLPEYAARLKAERFARQSGVSA